MIARIFFGLTTILFGSCIASEQNYDAKLKELNIELPPVGKPVANYVKAVRSGHLLFLAGHGPQKPDGSWITGKVGQDITLEQGYDASRLTAIQLLATIQSELGTLNRVKRIIKVNGMVNCTPEFADQPKVINGCSDLLVSVFGEQGRHARAAVGMNSLPMNTAVEIDMVIEVSD
jgi:enamine deaminase RidA (YjgF/YER057c/UK114 family)